MGALAGNMFKLNNVNEYVPRFQYFKGALSSLKQFFATKSPLKLMKNAFYFTLKDISR